MYTVAYFYHRNGTGKSGVFVAMDYLIQLIKNGDTHVDIFNLVHTLISNREKLIENEVSHFIVNDICFGGFDYNLNLRSNGTYKVILDISFLSSKIKMKDSPYSLFV